jgi:hypothetical protein
MAFKTTGGVDFGEALRKMRERNALSPEEKAALEARERFADDAREIVKDADMRDVHSVDLRTVTLAVHPDVRGSYRMKDVSGERIEPTVLLIGYRDDGQPYDPERHDLLKRAVFYPSEAQIASERGVGGRGLDHIVRDLDESSRVTMLGRSVPRNWKDRGGKWQTVHEFHAMRIGEGVQTREQLMAQDPGGLVSVSRRYVAAGTDAEREAIAREHLGQEPAKAGLAAQAASVGEARSTGAKGPSPEDDDIDALLAEVVGRATSRAGR